MSRPKIALACGKEGHSMSLNKEYLDAIWRSGGLAVVLPYTDDDAQIQEYTELFDGFMFCGGGDVNPKYYNEEKHPKTANISSERDRFESKLFRAALKTNKPILGICRGEQFINVLLGGTLYQHIDGHTDNRGIARDGQSHSVALGRSGLLFSLIGKENVLVNTYHHQCVKALADVLVPDAESEDGYIEAYHLPSHPFCLGVQWHPELFYDKDESSVKIFTAFVDACR